MPRSVLARMAQRCATPTVQGLVCAVLAIVLFTSFTVLSRLGLTASSLAPWDLAMLRFGMAGLVLVPVLLRRGWGGLRLAEVAALVLTGGLGFALFAYAGFRWAPASYGGVLLHGTIPLFTLVLVSGLSRQRVPTQAWLAGLLMLVGIAAIAADSQGQPLAHPWLGGGALLLAALCWSAYGLLCQRLRLEPLHAVAIVATGSLLVFLPIYALLPAGGMGLVAWREIAFQAFFQGIVIGVVSGLLYTRAVVLLGAQRTALCTAAVPGLTLVAALCWLDERPSSWVWLGAGLVSVGMLVGMLGRSTRPAPL